MPVFNYVALDSNGERRSGSVDARTQSAAVELLKKQGLLAMSVDAQQLDVVEAFSDFRGVPFGEVVSFTRQLSTMISAGLAISKCLEVLSTQTTNRKFKNILSNVLKDVESGAAVANAMARYPDVFSATYIALVRAGEASGKLDDILQRLANTMEAERALRAKFKAAMIYPTIVMFAMVGVFFILMIFVIPNLAGMYESLDVELPAVTQLMITLSDFMRAHVFIILIVMVGSVIGGRYFLRSPAGKEIATIIGFKVPVFGGINRKKELTSFTRTLGLLVSSAVPIVEALAIVAEVVQSKVFSDGAREAARSIEKGGTLSNYLKANDEFPPILGNMVATGEETGKLDEILGRLADFFDSETEHAVAGLSAALEPIILIMLGGMVGFLIISIITPIYKITSAL